MRTRTIRIAVWALLALAFVGMPFLIFAADGPPAAGVSPAPGGFSLSSAQWLIPVIVPLLIVCIKSLWPSVPRGLIPYLCPALGLLADVILRSAGASPGAGPEVSAALGALGLYLRELVDQAKKGLFGPEDSAGNMKALFAVVLASAFLSANASAQAQPSTPPLSTSAKDTITLNDQLFRAGEVQLDAFGTGRIEDLTNLSETKKGAGVGLNYFPWRAAGFGLEARGEGVDGILVDTTAVSLIGRFPSEHLRLAPEIKLGADYQWNERDWAVFAGVGLDYRLTRRVGVAVEVRGVRPIAGAEGEHILALLKLRYAF